jgi:ATP-dependent DNA helicase RecQ
MSIASVLFMADQITASLVNRRRRNHPFPAEKVLLHVARGHVEQLLRGVTAGQVDATADAKLVFRAIRETGERFGAVQIADVLSGTLNDKITERGHDRLGVFGLGAHRRKEDWQTLLRQIVAGGYLTLDIGGYGGVMLGDPALEIERGNTRFHHRPAEKRKKAGREDKVRSSVPATVGEGSEDLLQTLKQVRLQLAKERQVPAYLIFPDRSLIDMAERKPETEDDFSQVIGVGAAKLKLFASTFLDAIRDHARRREAG